MTAPDDLTMEADDPGHVEDRTVPDPFAPDATPPDVPPPEVLRVPIDRELEIEHRSHGPFAWRWTYRRSADSQKSGAVGQDYLTMRYGGSTLTFALCDGVGQSYFGDVAAGLLGDAL